jgi:hypothetical protein
MATLLNLEIKMYAAANNSLMPRSLAIGLAGA